MSANEGQLYRKIVLAIWTDPVFCRLSVNEKLVFLYLVTCRHNHMTGIMNLDVGYAVIDLVNLSREAVIEAMVALEAAGLIKWDRERSVIWVVSMAKHNATKGKAAPYNRKHLLTLHGSPLVDEFRAAYPEYLTYAGDAPAPSVPRTAGEPSEPAAGRLLSDTTAGAGDFADDTAAAPRSPLHLEAEPPAARTAERAAGGSVPVTGRRPESGAAALGSATVPARGNEAGGGGPADDHEPTLADVRAMTARLARATTNPRSAR